MDFLSWMYERNTFYSKILSAKNKEPDEKYISEAKQECDIWPVHAIGATAFGISMPHSGFSWKQRNQVRFGWEIVKGVIEGRAGRPPKDFQWDRFSWRSAIA